MISTCMCSLCSLTPIRRWAMATDPPCAWGLTTSLLLPDPTIHGTSQVFPINPSRRFSSSMRRSLLHHLRPARPLLGRFLQQLKGLSSLRFVSNLDSFEDSSNVLLTLNLQSPLKVLKSSDPCTSTLVTASAFPLFQTYD